MYPHLQGIQGWVSTPVEWRKEVRVNTNVIISMAWKHKANLINDHTLYDAGRFSQA
jgi:hypothetical protein